MKYLPTLILLSAFCLFSFSCEETPEDIKSTLFDTESIDSRLNDDGFYDPTYYFSLEFDQYDDGNINYNEVIGFDFYVENENPLPFMSVTVNITSITPSTYISGFDSDPGTIEMVDSYGGSEKPTNWSWCYNSTLGEFVNCYTSSYDIYLGSFYFETTSAGSTSLIDRSVNINFGISFYYNNIYYYRTYSEEITIEA